MFFEGRRFEFLMKYGYECAACAANMEMEFELDSELKIMSVGGGMFEKSANKIIIILWHLKHLIGREELL